jgi:membrane peptidoglycan carboxypeptidase
VKNLFFVEREKTISRKVQEAVITWQIERSLSKQQLLELYLNIIELGPKIYGIKAAAQHYFNRGPIDLTLLQAIWLGSIVPNPRAFYHQFRDGKVSDTWRTYLCWIGSVMVTREKVTAEEFTRLGGCNVVFGGGPDGSENPPPDMGLGHEGDPSLLEGDALHDKDGRAAPGVPVDEQP